MRGDVEGLHEHFELPEGSIANGCIAVIQYLDPDGAMRFGYIYDTMNLPLSVTVGLLELAKQDLCRRSLDESS